MSRQRTDIGVHETVMSGFAGVALVTGAASGIGSAVARLLVDNGCLRLVLADVSLEPLVKMADTLKKDSVPGLQVLSMLCDVRRAEDVENLVEAAAQTFGGINYCVNSAGIVSPAASSADSSLEDFKVAPQNNERGAWLSMRAELRQFMKQEKHPYGPYSSRGSIVNIAASQGLATAPKFPSYSAANYGIVGMTKTTAMDYIKSGVRFNCVCPGPTDTAGLAASGSWEDYAKTVPMQRVNRTEEVAAAVIFLLGDSASGINGVSLPVDGGWSLCHY